MVGFPILGRGDYGDPCSNARTTIPEMALGSYFFWGGVVSLLENWLRAIEFSQRGD